MPGVGQRHWMTQRFLGCRFFRNGENARDDFGGGLIKQLLQGAPGSRNRLLEAHCQTGESVAAVGGNVG